MSGDWMGSEGRADIYFDFNPPIHTNTTLNTLVSEIPVSIDELEQPVEIQIFPNPFDGFTTFQIGDIIGSNKIILKIFDVNGRLMNQYDVKSYTKIQVGRELNSGIYFYELKINDKEMISRGKMIKT